MPNNDYSSAKKSETKKTEKTDQPEELIFTLTTESLVAQAIAEQIELDRQMNGSWSPEDSTRRPQIDPSFQRAFDNI